jgi:hypothetical protein
MDEGYPEIPESAVPETWALRGRSEDRLFDAGAASVIGRTVLYADADVEAALDAVEASFGARPEGDAGQTRGDRLVGIDTVAPFGFATALSFRPSLAPGIGPATLLPMILNEARGSFADDFRSRGFEEVDRDRGQRIRTETDDRARLTKYTAAYPLSDGGVVRTMDIEGWLAVWTRGNSFRVAGGAYPTTGLANLLADRANPPAVDPSGFRDQLIGLIRAVR